MEELPGGGEPDLSLKSIASQICNREPRSQGLGVRVPCPRRTSWMHRLWRQFAVESTGGYHGSHSPEEELGALA